MLEKLFGKKNQNKEVSIIAPLTGEMKPIEEVPDPTFAEKMMGDGIAIEPTSGEVVAPVDGEVIQIFPTKHAVGLLSTSGVEILIHIGLETVGMDGEGFTGHVQQGDKVKTGHSLITFDLELVREKAESTMTPIVITNTSQVKNIEKLAHKDVVHNETEIMKVRPGD